jgi:molybdate transport system substrate-binding protein
MFSRRVNDKIRLIGQLAVFVLLAMLISCNPSAQTHNNPTQLTVFAAASLTESFTTIANEFEANHPGVEVWLNFAGSQTLRLQIEQGARADVFASANQVHAHALLATHLIEEPIIFAHNRLVVIVPVANPASIETLADLAQPDIKVILAGPTVPVGRYARQVLTNLDTNPTLGLEFSRRVLNNLVSEEDTVKAVVSKVQLGEADAGIVYVSDVTPAVANHLSTLAIPPSYNIVADYPIAVVSDSDQPDLARQFIDFVLSSQGQALLTDHGFQPVAVQPTGSKP